MKRCLPLLVLTLASLQPAQSAILAWYADLTTAAEIPTPNVGTANPVGFGTVLFDDVTNVLTVTLSWSGLTGQTTQGHIHCCVATPPGTVGVALGLWNPSTDAEPFPKPATGTFSKSWDLDLVNPFQAGFTTANGGTALLAFQNALLPALNGGTSTLGRAYFNLHTAANPPGEIRGNLAPVPEPASVVVVLSGLALLALRRRLA